MTTCRSSCHQHTNHHRCHHLHYDVHHHHHRCHPDLKENSLEHINYSHRCSSSTPRCQHVNHHHHHRHCHYHHHCCHHHDKVSTIINQIVHCVQHMGTSAEATATIRRSCQNDEGVCEVTRRDCSTNLLVIWRSFNATTTQRIDPQCYSHTHTLIQTNACKNTQTHTHTQKNHT